MVQKDMDPQEKSTTFWGNPQLLIISVYTSVPVQRKKSFLWALYNNPFVVAVLFRRKEMTVLVKRLELLLFRDAAALS